MNVVIYLQFSKHESIVIFRPLDRETSRSNLICS